MLRVTLPWNSALVWFQSGAEEVEAASWARHEGRRAEKGNEKASFDNLLTRSRVVTVGFWRVTCAVRVALSGCGWVVKTVRLEVSRPARPSKAAQCDCSLVPSFPNMSTDQNGLTCHFDFLVVVDADFGQSALLQFRLPFHLYVQLFLK